MNWMFSKQKQRLSHLIPPLKCLHTCFPLIMHPIYLEILAQHHVFSEVYLSRLLCPISSIYSEVLLCSVRTILNSLILPHPTLHSQPSPENSSPFAVRNHVLLFCVSSVRPVISCAVLTSVSLSGPQRPNHELSCFCQITLPSGKHPPWLVPPLAGPATFHLVLRT